jgi:hypothetical protein
VQPVTPQITHHTWPTIVDTLWTLIFMMGQGGYCTQFGLERRPKIPWWLATTYGRFDFPGHMTKNRWLSIDAHFHDGAGRVLLSVLPIKVGKNDCMTDYDLSDVWFPKMHDQKSLTRRWRAIDAHFHDGAGRVLQSVFPMKAGKNRFMSVYNLSEVWFPRTQDHQSLRLHWRSFSWWGREGIAIRFAYKGRQKWLYDLLQPIGAVISQDAWPKIIDAPLTLIFMMGQGGHCNLFCL